MLTTLFTWTQPSLQDTDVDSVIVTWKRSAHHYARLTKTRIFTRALARLRVQEVENQINFLSTRQCHNQKIRLSGEDLSYLLLPPHASNLGSDWIKQSITSAT